MKKIYVVYQEMGEYAEYSFSMLATLDCFETAKKYVNYLQLEYKKVYNLEDDWENNIDEFLRVKDKFESDNNAMYGYDNVNFGHYCFNLNELPEVFRRTLSPLGRALDGK